MEAVRQVYQELYNNGNGYKYAGWALGVANGDTFTGQSALQFLQGTALMGLDSQTCKNLSAAQIDQVRIKMAEATLDKMIEVANNEGGGYLKRELDYRETQEFHEAAFKSIGLSIQNWTLQAPMDLLPKAYGQAFTEKVWAALRDTGGTGLDSLLISSGLSATVFYLSLTSSDAAVVQQAQQWLTQVPGIFNSQQVENLFGVLRTIVPSDLVADPFTGVTLPWASTSTSTGLNLSQMVGDGITTRLNDTWVATDLGNGSRLLQVSPSTPNTVVVLSSGVYQKLEIPDGKGGYLQVAMGDKTTDVTSWSGVPGQSEQLKRVLTTQTDAGQKVQSFKGTVLETTTDISTQTVNGQTVQVTETVNHLAQGTEIASSKELVTSGGARIVNSTTADGHIQEDTWATVDGKQTLQSSKIISYSQAERDTAALDVSLAGLELMQALRAGNKVQAVSILGQRRGHPSHSMWCLKPPRTLATQGLATSLAHHLASPPSLFAAPRRGCCARALCANHGRR